MKKSKSTVNMKGLALALGVDAGQLSREAAKHSDFPCAVRAGRRIYDVDQVQAWRKRCIRSRPRARKIVAKPAAAKPPQLVTLPVEPLQTPGVLQVLQSGTASALEISRAVVQLVSQRVANAETFSANDVDALKKSLGELRQAEADYLDLAEKQGRLIDRDTVKRLVGEMAARLVRCLGVVEVAISGEFSVWLADPAIATMPADTRARKIREFVAKTCHEVRRQEAEGVDKLIDLARKEDEDEKP